MRVRCCTRMKAHRTSEDPCTWGFGNVCEHYVLKMILGKIILRNKRFD